MPKDLEDDVSGAEEASEPGAAPPTSAKRSERGTLVVRPGVFLTAVILGCMAMGLAIYWLLRGMRI